MKRTTITTAVLATLIAFAGTMVFGQMATGNRHQSMMASQDSTGKSGMMGNMDMMKNMSGQCQMMSDDFSNLESHFEKMMKENDITVLKAEMQKHYAMMQSMHKQMTKHGDMCKSMMSNMGSGDMKSSCGMMGKKSDESSGGHVHDH